MHPIPVRKMAFEIPTAEDFEPKWVADNALISYTTTGVSLYVHWLEPFLVKSLQRVFDQVKDERLHEEVDRFCKQEAQHYRQHQRFNEPILAQGYPGLQERFDRLKADFDSWLANEGDRWCVGFVEGFEAYTTKSAIGALKSRVFDHPKTDRRMGELFKWHLTEEIEHRNVAFDVYEHLYGSWAFRVKMCWIAQWHIWNFCMDCARIMSAHDRVRLDESYAVKPILRWIATAAVLPIFASTYLPGYTPRKLKVPEGVAALSAHYTERAESAS
jgi:predicted metal-dependent hydrolase